MKTPSLVLALAFFAVTACGSKSSTPAAANSSQQPAAAPASISGDPVIPAPQQPAPVAPDQGQGKTPQVPLPVTPGKGQGQTPQAPLPVAPGKGKGQGKGQGQTPQVPLPIAPGKGKGQGQGQGQGLGKPSKDIAIGAVSTDTYADTMTCATIQRSVANSGATILHQGDLYDRVVTSSAYCQHDEHLEPFWILSTDNSACFAGYVCRETQD
jgi:hypothetical protein